MQPLTDKTSHYIVPAGSYTWVKTKGEVGCACSLLLTSSGLNCFEHLEYIVEHGGDNASFLLPCSLVGSRG